MSHFEQRLESDLGHIRDWVWKLGDEVEQAMRHAKRAMLTGDEKLAYSTVLGDNPINRHSRECDRLCHTFIARHLPGAGHLREMAATIRVNVALERIGDYAVTICRESVQAERRLPERFAIQIDRLADEAIRLLHESRVTFRDGNAEAAKALMILAKQVEANADAVYRELFAADNTLDARSALVILVVFNMIKRVADQSKNICDQTVYAVRGIAKIPRIYHFLFLAQPQHAGAVQLAVAIGRKNYSTAATFQGAAPGPGQEPGAGITAFLAGTGLPDEQLATEPLEGLRHDLSNFDVVIALEGTVRGFLHKLPFRTSALEWSLFDDVAADDYPGLYRVLHARIGQLMDLVAGDEAA